MPWALADKTLKGGGGMARAPFFWFPPIMPTPQMTEIQDSPK